jgi:hypothetical protein
MEVKMAGNNFGNALSAFFKGLGDQDLAIAAQPLRNALQNIIGNSSAANVAAQGAMLAVALPAALPAVAQTAIKALATEGLALLDSVLPGQPAG